MSPQSGSDLHFLALLLTSAYTVRPVHHMMCLFAPELVLAPAVCLHSNALVSINRWLIANCQCKLFNIIKFQRKIKPYSVLGGVLVWH